MSNESTSNTTVTQNTKEKSGSKFWAWFLAIALLVLAGLFLWDKISSNNKYNALAKEHQDTSEEFRKYRAENESMGAKYDDLLASYKQLNEQLGGNASTIESYKALLASKDSALHALQNSLKTALVDFKSDEIKVESRDGKLYVIMLDKLLFKSGSADVESKGIKAIKTLARELSNNPNVGIMVEGHTDNIPVSGKAWKDNWELSTARANSVVRALSDGGLPQKRLAATGRAEYYPVASNATEAGRAQNRRTEIILTPFSVERVNAK
ncbi:MAG: OmpA family protein [Bacteroidales bacterium]|nr:OmpA family protein [Bacteroidales bacterium]